MPNTRKEDTCLACGDRIPRRTRTELLKLLSELHGELEQLPVPAIIEKTGGHMPYRVGHVQSRISEVLQAERSSYCSIHGRAAPIR